MKNNEQKIDTLNDFWPFYLSEHSNPQNRMLHFVGSAGALVFIAQAVFKRKPSLILFAILCGYGFSWIGHFFIEKNKPAAFKYPVKSLISDYRMFINILNGNINKEIEKGEKYLTELK